MPDAPWRTIPELVDDAARRFADDEALVEDDERWTFTELADRIHVAARALMASGVQRGDRARHVTGGAGRAHRATHRLEIAGSAAGGSLDSIDGCPADSPLHARRPIDRRRR